MIQLRHYLAILVFLALSACGGGGDAPEQEEPANIVEEITVSGVAQLGLISDATVKLFKLPEMTLISETKTSSDSNNYGAFSFENIVLEDQYYYLIETVGGTDTDPNDDGIVIEEEMVEIQGKVRAIVSSNQLSQNTVRVTVLSDMIYQQFDNLENISPGTQIEPSKLNTLAQAILLDTNSDSSVTYEDVLAFNPLFDQNKLKLSYSTIQEIYIPSVYLNLTKSEQLAALKYIYDYQIELQDDVIGFEDIASIFPDENLAACVQQEMEYSGVTDAKLITFLSCHNKAGECNEEEDTCDASYISDITGLEVLVNLQELLLDQVDLVSFNASNNLALTRLVLGGTQLSSIDISNNTALTFLYITDSKLSNIDLSNNTALTRLSFSGNPISSLDISKNTVLASLYIADSVLSHIDLTNNTALHELVLSSNQLNNIDLTNNTALNKLVLSGNQLSYIDLTNNTQLVRLDVSNNQLTSINFTNNKLLEDVLLSNNPFTQDALDYLATVSWIETLIYPQSDEADSEAFITTWRVKAGETITIPTSSLYTYGYTVDWGDDSEQTIEDEDAPHTYSQAGDYNITIKGVFPAISFLNAADYSRERIISIEQWGNIQWKSMSGAFMHCKNLTSNASDIPNLVEVSDMGSMFLGATSFTGDLSNWDVSNVTDMYYMFGGAASFTGDLSNWDVSNVADMTYMFLSATSFNGDLSRWDISNVTDMNFIFGSATSFTGGLSSWDVSNVTNMTNLFNSATNFTGDLSNWDVSNVTNMNGMFNGAKSYTADLSRWDVSNVVSMVDMFNAATSFTSDISSWDVSNVNNMTNLFNSATNFTGDLSHWDVSSVTNMTSMFNSATNFTGNLSRWDVSNVVNMTSMFSSAASFTGDLSNWDISSILNYSNFSLGAGALIEPSWP